VPFRGAQVKISRYFDRDGFALHHAVPIGFRERFMNQPRPIVESATALPASSPLGGLKKCKTGIQGLDEITEGGLPQGRTTLVCGSAGCGKTLLSLEFLVQGAVQYGEPGIFISFEESVDELVQNVASLGWDLNRLMAERKLAIDCFYLDPAELAEAGDYDLEGMFLRLGLMIDRIGAKRIVLDTIEVLFSGFANTNIVRAELRRLFRWLKDRGMTAIVTGERGEGTLTRQGIEEYVSDCVIRLDQRVQNELSTRRLQVLKYRGAYHGSNEYPFLIDRDGLSVAPITSLDLQHQVLSDRVSSGIPSLDLMLGGNKGGYFVGSSVLVTGMAGTGKSTIAAHFARSICETKQSCLYIAFEESPQQIIRNMRSIGVDLAPYLQQGLLDIQSLRPTSLSMEQHLLQIHRSVEYFKPNALIIDPIGNFMAVGNLLQVKSFFIRLIDHLKSKQVTTFMTNLIVNGMPLEHTEIGISSLMDTWLEVRSVEVNGERNRLLHLIKSRGMNHSNQVREFRLSAQGVELLDVYLGQGQVLTGTARAIQEAADHKSRLQQQQQIAQRQRHLRQQQQEIEAKLALLQMQLEASTAELDILLQEEQLAEQGLQQAHQTITQLRRSD